MNDPLVEFIFEELKEKDTDLTEKELKKFSKRCLKGCKIYIKNNNINDEEDHILNLKINFLILKLDKKIINKIINNENVRIKDVLNAHIYETHLELKTQRDSLMGKIVDINSYSCNLYQCPRCKAREHSYKEIQTRCLDEPKTIKCICLVCGMKFGIS